MKSYKWYDAEEPIRTLTSALRHGTAMLARFMFKNVTSKS